tara:strand:- start:1782 stop:2000 length:219 start_codon:yes stop_codon:yes gene_type:complete
MIDLEIKINDIEYQYSTLDKLSDKEAMQLYDDLKWCIDVDWNNPNMQSNYRIYICEIENILGKRNLINKLDK